MPKPFDLQKALAGKPVLGPDGKPIRRLIHVPEKCYSPNVLVVLADGMVAWFCEDDRSLTMADQPKKRVELWMNIYKSDTITGYRSSGHLYASEEEARNVAATHCGLIAQAYVTFEVEDEA